MIIKNQATTAEQKTEKSLLILNYKIEALYDMIDIQNDIIKRLQSNLFIKIDNIGKSDSQKQGNQIKSY